MFARLAILILVFLSLHAEAKDVYLGLAEPGSGESLLGHSVLIFTSTGGSPLTGEVYSYGIRQLDIRTFLPEKMPAIQYFQITSIVENRSLMFLKLKLTEEEINKLEERAGHDVALGAEFSNQNWYTLVGTNCVTYLFRVLNEIVTPDRQIHLSGSLLSSLAGGFKSFRDNIRFRIPSQAIVALSEHPLADGEIRWTPRFEIRQAQVFRERLQPNLESLALCQHWKPQTSKVVELTMSIALREKNLKLLESVRKLQNQGPKCSDEHLSRKLWTAVHDILPLTATQIRSRVKEWGMEN